MNSTNVTFCNLKDFSREFRNCHIYLSILICTLGSILNAFNIFILRTKQMRSPTNYILTALAIADVFVMLEYIPFSFLQKSSLYYTFNFATFIIFHAIFTNAFHFISCCLAIVLAVWRYIAIKFPQNNQVWCSESRTKYAIFLTYLSCAFLCIPLALSMKINSSVAFETTEGAIVFRKLGNSGDLKNITAYAVGYRNSIFKNISFIVYGLVLKLFPCILLVALSFLLIAELFKAQTRRKALRNNNKEACSLRKKVNQKQLDDQKQFNRTTQMLLAVLLLFLITEFPQAMMGLLLHVLGDQFYKECYVPLGDLFDILTLTASSINFVLYCIMSQKFREVFGQTFLPYISCSKAVKGRWMSIHTEA